ncbi:MAG: arylsulfatase [Paludibacter sp.]|nr:arylsulfatase [Paludibacter sp.]
MKKEVILFSATALVFGLSAKNKESKPNVIVILADDLGYGDVSANGSKTIKTPNMDRLANEGIRFTNGYASSATSTPSRYALLTGMYPWKNKNAKILGGDAPLLIDVNQQTLPKMMQHAGYKTAVIGKWHLGMGNGNTNWNENIKPGAKEVGFDYSCLIAATVDRVPSVYIENGNVVGLNPNDPIEVNYKKNFEGEPTALTNPEMLKMKWTHGHNQSIHNGIPRIGFQKGGKSALWVDEDMADYFVDKVKNYLVENKDKSFFLYYGLHQPHVPRTPHARFVGASGMGPRGDAIIEADWCIGELLKNLEKNGLLENTLIIFSSDNGPVLDDGYQDDAVEKLGNHKPAGPLRGGKYSLFDAGTHVPFFVYWKGEIKPAVSDAMVCQMDLLASLSKFVEQPLKGNFDSQNVLPALLGKSKKGRKELVLEADSRLAFRSGDWAFIPAYKGPVRNQTGNEVGNLPENTLYNLKTDVGQTENVNSKEKTQLKKIEKRFFEIVDGFYKSDIQ